MASHVPQQASNWSLRTATATWLWRRFSFRRLLINPLRIIIVILSIALATTLWGAVTKVSLASVSSFEDALGLGAAAYGVLVQPVGGRLSQSEVAHCFSPLSSQADMIFIRREPGILRVKDRSLPVTVSEVSSFTTESLSANQSFSGDLSDSIRKQLSLSKGDAVTVDVSGSRHKILVAASNARIRTTTQVDVILPLSQVQGELSIDSVLLNPIAGAAEAFVSQLSPFLRSCLGESRGYRIETTGAVVERGDRLLGAYRLNLLIMSLMTLVVCALLVSQAMHVTLRGILRELSILRALGVSQIACFLMVVIEGAIVGLIGGLLGLTIGRPLIVWITGFLIQTASEIYHIELDSFGTKGEFIRGIIIVCGVSALCALAAAYSARAVLSLAPYRGTRIEGVHHAPLHTKRVFMTALLCSGVALLSVTLPFFYPGAFLAYGSVLGVVVWGACCTPLALLLVSRFIPHISRSIPFRLARGVTETGGRHFVLSAVAATIAIALMVGLSVMVTSFRETLTLWSKTRLSGDLFVSAALSGGGNEARIDVQKVSSIKDIPGIKRLIPYYETASSVLGQDVVVAGVNLRAQCERRVYPYISGGCLSESASWQQRAIISESAKRKLKLSPSQALSIDGQKFLIQGVVQEFGSEQPIIVIDEAEFKELYPGHNPKTLTIDLDARSFQDAVRKSIEQLDPVSLVVRDNAQLLELVESMFNRTFRVTESVRWIVFCIAILGLVSTSAQYSWERRRELKTSLVLGVSRLQLGVSAAIEGACIAGASVFAGLIAGIGVGWCLTSYINPSVFGWSLRFHLSHAPFVEALTFCALVVVLSALVSGRLCRLVRARVGLADE